MEKMFYPTVFHSEAEGGFWVEFPDFPECFTQGEDMQQAYEMAVDALGLAITSFEKGKELPKASFPSEIKLNDGILVIVEFDLAEYRKKHSSRAIKKTLTIPEWLNEEAIKANLNFSQVLQEALMQKIGMTR